MCPCHIPDRLPRACSRYHPQAGAKLKIGYGRDPDSCASYVWVRNKSTYDGIMKNFWKLPQEVHWELGLQRSHVYLHNGNGPNGATLAGPELKRYYAQILLWHRQLMPCQVAASLLWPQRQRSLDCKRDRITLNWNYCAHLLIDRYLQRKISLWQRRNVFYSVNL